MDNQYLEVGKITNIHGIMGEVRIQPWADSPEFLCDFETLYLGDAHFPLTVQRARTNKTMTIIKFEPITDVHSALSLRGTTVYIDRNDVKLPDGHFFIVDLQGLSVIDNETGEELGKIAEVLTPPAHNLYVVRGGAREILIPAVPQFVVETNIEGGFIRVQMMEGL